MTKEINEVGYGKYIILFIKRKETPSIDTIKLFKDTFTSLLYPQLNQSGKYFSSP